VSKKLPMRGLSGLMDAPDEEVQGDAPAPALAPPSIEARPPVQKPKVVKLQRPQLIKAGIVIDEEKWHRFEMLKAEMKRKVPNRGAVGPQLLGEAIDMVLSKYGKK
jgi:hypothetical protein